MKQNTNIEKSVNTNTADKARCLGGAPSAGIVGGVTSNTPPPSSNWIAAEDWFEFNFYVDWNVNKWDALTEKLDNCKRCAGIRNAPNILTGFFVGGNRIEVEPTGAKVGKGKKGIYCSWRFTSGDMLNFKLINRTNAHKTMPNVFIIVDGQACTIDHAENWFQRAGEIIQLLGGTVVKNKLSRVDICLDMPNVPINKFEKCFDDERYICRANAKGKMESNGKTIYFGENPIKARIYDKLREVKKKADPIKTLAMKLYRWGGKFPNEATRVEFQIRRDGLKTRGIDNVQDYLDRRASLAKYLTTQWLRLTLDHVDKINKNQSKARTLPLWQDVSNHLVAWGNNANAPLTPLPKAKADVEQLFKQMLGVAKAAAKYQGKKSMNDDELLRYIVKKINRTMRLL